MKATEARFTAAVCLAAALLFATLPCHAQQSAPDSTAQQKDAAEEKMRRWGAGVRLSKLYGLSVRYALTERFTVQVAGIPVPLGDEITGGGRLLYKLYARPSYNFYVAGGASLFRGPDFTNPFTGESERNRGYTIFATLGGEYRFARRLGLGGGASLGYQRSAVLDRNAVLPLVELGLHYYFR
jgi:hypothetical protein